MFFIRAALSRLRVCLTPCGSFDAAGPTLFPCTHTSTRPGNERAASMAAIACILSFGLSSVLVWV